MEKWYRADFSAQYNGNEIYPDSDYFTADNDTQAVEIAKETAAAGRTYADCGHVDFELIQVVEVDPETECFNEIKIIYY